jgi:hypothetical protein
MKKFIAVLFAAGFVFGFVGLAIAQDCTTCLPPQTINRGCEEEQAACLPFDYENVDSFSHLDTAYPNYCEEFAKQNPRVLFPICDCVEEVGDLNEGDVVDISLEILVNGAEGNNGAYWAQDVNGTGIGLETYPTESAACADSGFDTFFGGVFQYGTYQTDGTIAYSANVDTTYPDCDPDYTPTIIEPLPGQAGCSPASHGYTVTAADELNNNSIWAIDIPHIVFDPTMVGEGDEISVRICVALADPDDCSVASGGVCGEVGCCCTFLLGDLCCPEATESFNLIYPYTTPMNDANWWYGMVITNLTGGAAGTANITVYENDGDSESVEVEVPANGMFVRSNMELMDIFGEDIGDSRAYFDVETDFSASGFLFIGNDTKAEAMGYLPLEK